MKRDVVLSIQGRQRYGEQEPETIELVTGGRWNSGTAAGTSPTRKAN